MHRVLMTEHWPHTPDGKIVFVDTNHALMYALVIWDDAARCTELAAQLLNLRQEYEHTKGLPDAELAKVSELAFAIQFTREASEEVSDLQSRAREYAGVGTGL